MNTDNVNIKRVLIVDDNSENLGVIANYLEEAGFKPSVASSGPIALERVLRVTPELILLDVKMPAMNGFEVCSKLKENPVTKPIPVIFLTALTDSASKSEGFLAGAVDYISKPVNKAELIARVSTHVEIFRHRNHLELEISKRAKELRASEEKYRILFESSMGAILILDPIKGYVDCNPAALKLFGISSKAGLLKLSPADVSPEFQADGVSSAVKGKKAIEFTLENGSNFFEWVYRRTDGTLITTNVLATRFEINGKVYIQGTIRDITARRKAELELVRAKNYISNIIDSMPSVLVGIDPDGIITQWNLEAERATGLPAKDAVGQPHEKVAPRLAGEMKRVGEAMQTRKMRSDPRQARKEDGETRYEDVTVYPLIANGVEGAVIRIDDVTEQVRLEEMMVQSEKMLSIGGLAAGMAHEINNPLAGMMQTANVMSHRLTNPDLPANQRAAQEAGASLEAIHAFMEARGIPRMLEAINKSGRRAAEIVDNMLSFARKSDAVASTYDVARLLDKTLELALTDYDLKKQYDFKKIRIVKEYEENLPSIPCEGSQIQQVLLNILRNGAQAMNEHPAERADRVEESQTQRFILRLSKEIETDMLRIEIEDNGPGMNEATRKRTFEPFFTTKPPGIGTGLGLSVSYFIITQNHAGAMSVESEPGQGATFIIRLPLDPTRKSVSHEND
ncbi:MAG: PAS domain S-box protein [bacterium]|nr:PAS domain S-box protein [bacterium]